MRHHILVASALALAVAGQALAQRPDELLARPRLPAGADVNDWEAYYDLGTANFQGDRRTARAAMFWAARLQPERAEPLYGQWLLFWLQDAERFAKYLQGDQKVARAPDVLRADSLRVRAFARNPFVHQGLRVLLYDQLPGRWREDVVTAAWIQYANARLPVALDRFGEAIRKHPERYGHLRYQRATIFVALGQPDSALAELTVMLAALRAADDRRLATEYEPKDMLEFAIGLLHSARGRHAEAAAALQRAVVENMAFVPAHVALGKMALQRRDTAVALQELRLAVELDPGDVAARLALGDALRAARLDREAAEAYRAALRLEPFYAEARLKLAGALEAAGVAGAADELALFVEGAPRAHPRLAWARKRLAELRAAPGG